MAHLGDRRKWPLLKGARYEEGCRNCNMTIFFLRKHNMFTELCSFSLSHNDNPVIYNIIIAIEIYTKKSKKFVNENVNETKLQGSQHLLKYVCIIAINMLTAAV